MKAKINLLPTVLVLISIAVSQFVLPQSAQAACSGIVYVSPSGNNTNGCSWANAYTTLQSALNDPTLASGNQIWVASGTYYPDEGTGQTNNDRASTFTLVAGVSVYGGFNGTETLLTQRDSNPATNNTVLSGDIDQVAGNANNAYHVVTVAGTLSDTFILDGFTISDGNDSNGEGGGGINITDTDPTFENLIINNNESSANGGGVFVLSNSAVRTSYSAPTFTNVTFSNNTAARGGGVYLQNASPVLTSVTFTGNSATGGAGGGINSQTLNIPADEYSIPVLTDVVFDGNSATGGGGMFVTNSNAILNRVTFDSNTATRRGGGMLIEIASPTLTNVTFYGNISTETVGAAPRGGGAIMNVTGNPTINNATFSGNNSLTVGGDAIRNATNSNPVIRNSIFWDDVDDEITSDGTGTTTISDSVVEGGFAGGTNIITTNPLLSALANNGGFTETMAIGVGSSAIDTGNNATCASVDQRNVARPIGTACDIGAYEFQGATTLTVSPATGTYGNTVNLSATLDSGGTGVSGRTINFTLNGTNVGSAVTNGSGVATLSNVSLAGINAGIYLGGVGSGVGASFAGDGTYNASSGTATLTVNQRAITVTAVTDTKVYDSTNSSVGVPTITTGSLASGDTVTWTQTYDNKNVGTNKVLTPAGTVNDGNSGNNYTVTFVTNNTGVITAASLTVTGITANNKVYDGNSTATLNTGGATLVGVIGADVVTLNTAGATGTFSDKNIGVGKTVTVAGLTLSGADAGNYTLTQPTTTADITAATLTVTGITANNKVYDGNTTATLNTGGATLVGVIGADNVSLNTAGATGTFSDKNVGVGKTVTIAGLTLGGTDAGNYTLTQPTTTANITAATLTVTGITANDKVYDGNTTATLNTGGATLVGVIGADNVTLNVAGATGTFADANVGVGKIVTVAGLTLGGTDAGNYTLTQPTTTADITAATLTVTGITANNKVYDGNTTATLNTGGATLVGVIGADNVTLNVAGATGTFADKNVGAGKTVTVSGLTLGGTDAGNYSLTQPTTTADITAATLTVTGITANDKTYDGTTVATLNTGGATLVGVFGADVVTLNTAGATGTFADDNVGVGKTVTVAGLTIGGADSGNYTLTQPTTTATITVRAITVTAVTDTKVYDGTTASAGVPTITVGSLAAGDTVTWTQTFNNKNVGTNKILTPAGTVNDGNSGNNYSVTFASNNTGVITAAPLTVTGITANNKVYDGNTTATLNTGGATLVGVLGADNVTLNTAGAAGTFADKNVGAGKTVTVAGLTLSGTDAGNYTLTQPTTTADITAATLTVTGITANNKVYDGNTTATINTAGATLVGVIGADVVTLNTAGATGTFSDKNIGVGKTVTVAGLTLSGADAGNYTLTQPTTTADITAATLTVTGITANNKVYDGNTTATLNTGGATLVGVIGADNVTLNVAGATGTFADANVGVGKTVTIAGLTIGGADSGNYTLTQPTTTANITGASLTVTGITANDKTYDGTTAATLNTGGATLVGIIGGDVVTLDVSGATGTFADQHVGVGKTVTVAGLTLSGPDAGKYTLVQPTTTANITARPITVTAVTDTKAYDGTTSSTGVPTITSGSLAAGDTVTWTQTFDTPNVGTNKVLTPAGTVTDGNGGNNYNVTFATNNTGVITGLTLTVTGITANNKVYDGTTAATLNTGGAALVGVVGGDIVTLDVSGVAGTFADENVGAAKTVSITGLTLGGADAGNYSLIQPAATADITARPITVSAVTDTKVYDGTTSSTGVPTVTVGSLAAGDSLNFTQTFDTRHVGVGKTLTPAGSVNDGNSGNNYNVTLATDTTGQITARPITVTAVTDTKGYDTTTTSSGTPTITSGSLAAGDTATWSQTFATPDVGTGKTLIPAGTVTDGNGGNNYNVTFVNNTTGVITSATLNVIADNQSKLVGDPDPVFTFTITGFIAPDTIADVDTLPTCTVAVPHTNAGTYPITCSGGVDTNYSFTYVNGTLSVGVANQTITIVTGAPAGPLFPGDTFTVAATASSGLPVTYSASGACTNVGAVFTMNANAPGVCTVTYSQAGDSNYNPAPSLTETVDIALVVATNGIDSSGDTGDNVLAELEVATVGINQLIVTFNKDVYNPAGNTDPDDVTNPANYILVSDNGDGIQTTSCTTGITGGDVVIPVNSVVYTNGGGSGPFVATVNINGGVALPVGAYRFIVCGSTSVVDLNQIPLAGNNQATGTDFTRNFFVASASTLIPNTGFPQNEVTQIPQQPKDLAYTATDIWLEIPKLNVRMLIVGVPLGKNGWDVTWLGKNAGWLDGSAFPTWSGNSVITAHVWDANNKPGPFARLKDLRYGDQIIIRAYGQVFTYAVSESLLVSPTDTASMLKHSDKPMLTLITCEDYQDKSKKYSYRRMVRAMLVSVAKEK